MNRFAKAIVDRVTRALVPIVCPPRTADPRLDDLIAREVAASMQSFPVPIRAALIAGLSTYELAPLVWRLRPASRLRQADGERYFRFWWRGPLPLTADFALALKGLICQAYYESDVAKEELEYTPEAWIETVKRRRLELYGEEIVAREAALNEPDPLPGIEAPMEVGHAPR